MTTSEGRDKEMENEETWEIKTMKGTKRKILKIEKIE